MRLTRFDLLALLVATGAAIAGLVVWANGTVSLGMTLESDGRSVTVFDVTPGGLAARAHFQPGMTIVDLATVDGGTVERSDPIDVVDGGYYWSEWPGWDIGFDSIGGPLEEPPNDVRIPTDAIEPARIGAAVGGYVSLDDGYVEAVAWIDRSLAEFQLAGSVWIGGLSVLLAVALWRLLVHGLAGSVARSNAIPIAAAVAVPGLVLPLVQAGTAPGIGAGFLVPAASALVLGVSLAREHPERQWVRTGIVAAGVAAALATVLVVRYLSSQFLGNDPGMILFSIAAITLAPASVAATASGRTLRDRAILLSVGLIPVVAALLVVADNFGAVYLWIAFALALLIGWYTVPMERLAGVAGRTLGRVRSSVPAATAPTASPTMRIHEPLVTARFRDTLTIALVALVLLYGLLRGGDGYAVVAAAVAGAVALVIRNGFLGAHWSDAAIPLGAAIGIPIAVAGYQEWWSPGQFGWVSVVFALAGLSVADVLAARHSNPELGTRLLGWAAGVAAFSMVLWTILGSGTDEPLAFAVACLVPLVPGLPVAFAYDPDEQRAVSTRLETLAVALTLAVAVLVLTPLAWVPLVAWITAIVVWRRFALAPLLGLARRTQLQRDVAVAAAETERARLAADLHDDALQQLTMLVRTLDEKGQTDEADEAREIATKLRSVVGDLRLPILDDLGAGAALEWLVERVEPLAGGPVKLERSDESRPPANVELAVFRVAQEALTNAIKHGRPPIAVHYDVRADGRVTLAIDDAGEGIGSYAAEDAPKAGHFGLVNMQQRAEQIGALLDVRRWPAGGTRVALEWRPQ